MTLQGTLLIVGSQIAWAIGALFLKKLVGATNPLLASALIALAGAIFLLPVLFFFTKDIGFLTREEWLWAALRGVLWISIGGALFAYGMGKVELSHAALLALTYPLFATLLGIFFLGETIDIRFIIASGLFIAGYLVLTWK